MNEKLTLVQYAEIIKSGTFKPLNAHERLYLALQNEPLNINPQLFQQLNDEYLKPASQGYDLHKRMLILVGPPGSGKSTFLSQMKKALEHFSYTDQGAVYQIEGCPMQEDPLKALPQEEREKLPLDISGKLSPFNQYRLETEWGGDWRQVPVERFFISESSRKGIGTFFPGDPYTQDISDLIGAVDFSKVAQYGSQSDPRAYKYDGEIQAANRGLLELQEVFKTEKRLLYPFLSLAEEKVYKVSRQALIYADEVLIGHTNEDELKAFLSDKTHQALLNRMIFIRVPYELNLEREVQLYQAKIQKKDRERFGFQAIETLAMAFILTRIKKSKDSKTRLEKFEQLHEYDLESDGMTGLDPRYAFQVLANVCVRNPDVIKASDLLHELERVITKDYRLDQAQKEDVMHCIKLAETDYDNKCVYKIKQIILQKQYKEIDEKLKTYFHDYQLNSLHNFIGVDETNIQHFNDMKEQLELDSTNLTVTQLPEVLQDGIIDWYLYINKDQKTRWFKELIEPELNESKSELIQILNRHIERFV
ncbi:hypothetical protein [Aquisalibacillus elongatus]|uniref:Putative serine protein kinase PrkA n=1 Tax=Aquisalibacillus elongatus TaxID=485577 RepID=A0A3N5AYR0_9BACI|nr:hypothetical protein [Aquisalibacillus elongatus]RPF50107.1 putative serine protein kinase PrkA [Aquisalibacillus elongatus]